MKKLQLIFPILLVLFSSFTVFAGEKEVTDRVNEYLSAVKAKEVKVIDNILNDDADFIKINAIINKKEVYNKDSFKEVVKSGMFCNWASKTNVKIIDVQDAMAVALIQYESTKLVQKEYLTLVLSDEKWEVVNSVCSLSKK